jgi:hypothetical protein
MSVDAHRFWDSSPKSNRAKKPISKVSRGDAKRQFFFVLAVKYLKHVPKANNNINSTFNVLWAASEWGESKHANIPFEMEWIILHFNLSFSFFLHFFFWNWFMHSNHQASGKSRRKNLFRFAAYRISALNHKLTDGNLHRYANTPPEREINWFNHINVKVGQTILQFAFFFLHCTLSALIHLVESLLPTSDNLFLFFIFSAYKNITQNQLGKQSLNEPKQHQIPEQIKIANKHQTRISCRAISHHINKTNARKID